MFIVTYWPDWAGGKARQFHRDTLNEARRRLVYWLCFDPDMKATVYKDGVRLSVTALLEGREEPWS